MRQPPLSGIRVLDLSSIIAAPVTATMLGDFGAEVVKVEEPGRGDLMRRSAKQRGGRSFQWVQDARNKKSVTIDLRQEEGRALVRRMLPHFDVVVTNFRPPTLDKWQLGPDALLSAFPSLIVLYVTGYGLTGPYRDRGAFDRVASAFAGLTHASGEADRPSVRSGYALIDYMTAYMGAFGIAAALFERERNGGTGQAIDLALFEAGFRASEDALMRYSVTGEVRGRTATSTGRSSPPAISRPPTAARSRCMPARLAVPPPLHFDGRPGPANRCSLCRPCVPRRQPGRSLCHDRRVDRASHGRCADGIACRRGRSIIDGDDDAGHRDRPALPRPRHDHAPSRTRSSDRC